MNAKRDDIELEPTTEKAASTPEPFFRRYQVKIKAGVRAPALPTGGHPWIR